MLLARECLTLNLPPRQQKLVHVKLIFGRSRTKEKTTKYIDTAWLIQGEGGWQCSGAGVVHGAVAVGHGVVVEEAEGVVPDAGAPEVVHRHLAPLQHLRDVVRRKDGQRPTKAVSWEGMRDGAQQALLLLWRLKESKNL